MKTKLEMAHEYAKIMLDAMVNKNIDLESYDEIAHDAFLLADAMQAEADKRENNVSQDLSQEEWQPDWSKAPERAKWWAMDKDRIAHYFENKPTKYITMWFPYYSSNTERANNFEYTGDWKDSLRERP